MRAREGHLGSGVDGFESPPRHFLTGHKAAVNPCRRTAWWLPTGVPGSNQPCSSWAEKCI
jgi:hypothetical protein